MNFEHRRDLIVLFIIFVLLLSIFGLDTVTPVGSADYIFYFLPVAVTVFQRKPSLPLWTASICTVFSITGYFLSPPGIDPTVGQLNRSYAVITIWVMAYLVRQVIHSKNIVVRQVQLRSSQSLIAETIRGELSVDELCKAALSILAEKTGANIGVVYQTVIEPKASYLKLRSGYSLTPDEINHPAMITFGQGLIGQAAAEKKASKLSHLPEGYLELHSGLGRTKIREILICPLIADEQVVAVMELGFLGPISSEAEELMSMVSEGIAIGIRSASYKATLADMLEESQRQGEELQAQQEELRVVNEELESQSRALKESQVKLENQQAELEQSNQQLEEQAEVLERQKEFVEERNQRLIDVQQSLQEKAKELERASRYKSEFLANMSHELRTPLNSSLIMAKLLSENKEGTLTEEQVQFAENIYAAGNDLLSLINEILDLSKVEAGKIEIHPESVNVTRLIQSLEKTFAPVAAEKKLTFRIVTEKSVPESFVTDRRRTEQILKNFLSNAFKFTERGAIAFEVKGVDQGILFSVSDTGIGIREDQKDVIFEAFRQADGTTSRKYGGTGLGLSISKELAKLLQGEITVESQPGKGSTFSLLLPSVYKTGSAEDKKPQSVGTVEYKRPTATKLQRQTPVQSSKIPATNSASSSPNSRTILFIEDDVAFSKVLTALANEMGFETLVAHTADEGMTLAREALPQAIVLDIRLPDHSGLAVLDYLKSNPQTRHIPIHVVSAEDYSQAAMAMGAVGHLLKPVKREQLVETLMALEQKTHQKIKRVLVVEDDEIQRQSIVKLLTDPGIELEAIGNGREALQMLQTKTYDCMIMDLKLPDLSGYELLERMAQSDSPFSYPPVIVYTGYDLTRDEEEKLRKHAGSIIIKGAKSPDRLLSEVTLFLHRVETELPADRQKMLRELRIREKTLEKRKILLVDDDVRNIFALSSVLERQGAKVEIARNGKEALQKLETNPEIDMVLMDIMMPEMDGYEAIRKIRMQESLSKLPVIAVTAKAMRDDQERCIEAGANDYLAKPVNIEKLLSLIRVWMPDQARSPVQ